MKIRCPSCNAAYDMDESRVPAAGVNIKCPKCTSAFRVTKAGVVAVPPGESTGAAPGAVPLPAPGRPGAAPPSGRPPGASAPPAGPPPGVAPPQGRPPGAIASVPPPPAPAMDLPGLDFPVESGGYTGGSLPPGWNQTAHPSTRAPQTRPPGAQPSGAVVPLPSGRGGPPAAPALDFDLPDFGAMEVPAGAAPSFDLDTLSQARPPSDDPALDFAFANQGGSDSFDVDPPPAPEPTKNAFQASAQFAALGGRAGAEALGDDLGMLDFVDDRAARPVPTASASGGVMRWQVRRMSGKVFGPFEASAIVTMLQQGQLFGNEDISTDANHWVPITSEPQFAKERKAEPPGLAAAGGNRLPPPMMSTLDEAPPGSGPVPVDSAKAPAAPQRRREAPVWVRVLARRLPLLGAAAAGLVVVGGGLAMGLYTDVGFFGLKAIFKSAPAGPSRAGPKLAEYERFAAEGTFASWQKAVGAAQEAHKLDSDSEDARVALVIATGKLLRRYGTSKAEFEKARDAAGSLTPQTPNGRLAHAAIALVDGPGRVVEVKSLLQEHTQSAPAVIMLAEGHLLLKENKAAGTLLDDLLRTHPSLETALLRAEAARLAANTPAEESALLKALELAPMHARASLLLARLRVDQGRGAEASTLLAEVLREPGVRSLDTSEEALGHHLTGDLLVARRAWDEAAKEYQRASEQDQNNPRHRAALASLSLRQRKYGEAVTAFEKALEKSPDDVELLVGSGRALTGAANFVKANEALLKARKVAPGNPAVLVADGDLQTALGKFADSHKIYAEALGKQDQYVPALVADGRVYLLENRLEDARKRLEKAVEVAPANFEAQTSLGEYRLTAGDAAAARQAFEAALAVDAEYALAHGGLADALVKLGDDAGAKASYLRSVELDPRLVRTRERFARLLWRAQNRDGALEQLEAALALDPKDALVQAEKGAVLFELDRTGEAEGVLKTALSIHDEEPVAHDYYGRLLAVKGDTAQALVHLRRATGLDPLNAGTHYQLGLVNKQAEHVSDAADSFRRAIELDERHIDAREQLGEVLAGQNLCAEAIEIFRRALELDGKRAHGIELLADCEFKLDQTEQSLKHFKEALALDPQLDSVHYKLGRAYEKLNRDEEAIKSYVAATKAEPNNAFPHYFLGFVYKERGRKKDAIDSFEHYLAVAKDAKNAEEIKDEIFYLKEK